MIQFTLEHIVATVCASNLIVLLALYVLHSKNTKAMNERFEAQLEAVQESQTVQQLQASSLSAQLVAAKEFSQAFKTELSEVLSALQSTVQHTAEDTQSQVASQGERLQGSIAKLESVLLTSLSEQADNHTALVQAEASKLNQQLTEHAATATQQHQQMVSSVVQNQSQLLSQLTTQHGESTRGFDDQAKAAAALMGKLNNLSKDLADTDVSLRSEVKSQGAELSASVLKGNQALQDAIGQNGRDNRSGKFELRQQQLSEFARLAEMVQQIRINNMAELSNELAKHQELTVESEDAIKYLGECKVTRIEDKHTNQVTKIAYHEGKQSKLETFENNKLKYEMIFDDRQSPKVGTEYDESGREIFSYHYNAAGEISQRIEYTYTNGKQQSQTITL
ncbi:hypothetical protein [Ferrimonas aestuarii]|uniref:Uncharacterized protein n=1 Tax=Ferrimonas aestuarii TaxID=2569539 RepID=A0A4V5NVV1_9GAMM|nr:hypothetical protein [Ferrimonas aestuarii]TKB52748.1 hypothetical protein FCL42_15680 [Ferrimonas aestuarii]